MIPSQIAGNSAPRLSSWRLTWRSPANYAGRIKGEGVGPANPFAAWTRQGGIHRLDAARRHAYGEVMNRLSGFVSLHPYFKVPPDKLDFLKAILPEFAAKTRHETGNLFYEFTVNGDEVFCREGYDSAEALLAHLENVSAMLAVAMKLAKLVRLEVHGPAEELAKLKAPLAELNPAWFTLQRGS